MGASGLVPPTVGPIWERRRATDASLVFRGGVRWRRRLLRHRQPEPFAGLRFLAALDLGGDVVDAAIGRRLDAEAAGVVGELDLVGLEQDDRAEGPVGEALGRVRDLQAIDALFVGADDEELGEAAIRGGCNGAADEAAGNACPGLVGFRAAAIDVARAGQPAELLEAFGRLNLSSGRGGCRLDIPSSSKRDAR